MRILHVLAERGFSGGEHQLLAVLKYLKEAGHESTLILNPNARLKEHVEAIGLAVLELRMRNDIDLLAIFRLRALFKRLEPDLIHFACSRSHKLGALAGLLASRRGAMLTTRRMDYPLGRGRFRRWLYGAAVDAVVVVSRAVGEEVLQLGIAEDRVHLVHDGVDTNELQGWCTAKVRRQARQALGIAEGEWMGLTVASLNERKGQDLLLDALQKLRVPEDRSLVWVLAGEGPWRARLEERAKTLSGRIEVRLPGQLDPIEEALAAADLFCLPSRREGLGVALLEAMAMGLPVIASFVGGMKEAFVSGESGLHVPVGDVDALASAIEAILGDRAQTESLGKAAKVAVARNFDLGRMCRQSEEIYRMVAQCAQ